MKQYITVKQLNEVKGKQRDILIKWTEKHIQNKYNGGYPKLTINDYCLSIGQMIEYLASKTAAKNRLGIAWLVDENDIINTGNLCDNLWKRVKHNLSLKSLNEMQQENL